MKICGAKWLTEVVMSYLNFAFAFTLYEKRMIKLNYETLFPFKYIYFPRLPIFEHFSYNGQLRSYKLYSSKGEPDISISIQEKLVHDYSKHTY